MKKTYIIPNSVIVRLNSRELIMQGSAKILGDVEVGFGGESEGGMSSDVKGIGDIDLWDEVW